MSHTTLSFHSLTRGRTGRGPVYAHLQRLSNDGSTRVQPVKHMMGHIGWPLVHQGQTRLMASSTIPTRTVGVMYYLICRRCHESKWYSLLECDSTATTLLVTVEREILDRAATTAPRLPDQDCDQSPALPSPGSRGGVFTSCVPRDENDKHNGALIEPWVRRVLIPRG